ncbi:MAG TPA: S24/S26 family peptidase [Opitutaceae bacterium]|nr:S24/S26 family peptidase [Opitutaceae bacterium]
MKPALVRRLRQGMLAAAAAAALGAGPGSCTEKDPRKAYVALSPLATVVPASEVRKAAEYYASLRPGAVVLNGEGDGMMPLYSSGTLIVVERLDFDALKEGMTVIYNDRKGRRVCHFLAAYGLQGWVTRGLNEPEYDAEPLTRDNFVGVVTMAFTPQSPPAP